MIEGKVLWWNLNRGWGFVSTAGHGDVFIHHSALEVDTDDLIRGELVQFEPVAGTVGTVGANIQRAA